MPPTEATDPVQHPRSADPIDSATENVNGSPAALSFPVALSYLKAQPGARAQRAGWNGKNMWVALQRPDENSKMTLPYLYMFTADGNLVPWLISQTDALAEDWAIIPPPTDPV